MKYIKKTFKILGKNWNLRVMSQAHYDKTHGADSLAMTQRYRRLIDLSPPGVARDTIAHELVHAYIVELCLYSSDFDNENLEEVFAELFSRRGAELLKTTARLHKWAVKNKIR